MVEVTKEFFNDGIWIKYDGININRNYIHPCGYDFLSFDLIEIDDEDFDVEENTFSVCEFSNGIYDEHPLENKTLEEILDIIGENNWSFERF